MLCFADYCAILAENHFQQALGGTVKTIGIITAENPGEKHYVKATNERRNQDLTDYFEKKGYNVLPLKGRFLGKQENPFMLLNITRHELVAAAAKFGQESVIWGQKTQEQPSFEFSYIKNGRTVSNGKLHSTSSDEMPDKHTYITFGGSKYTIKFD